MSEALAEVVGVRFAARGPLSWYRASGVEASAGSWVVAELNGLPQVGHVIVGRGQCLGFPAEPAALPTLVRAARPEEVPPPTRGAGQALLDSLPL